MPYLSALDMSRVARDKLLLLLLLLLLPVPLLGAYYYYYTRPLFQDNLGKPVPKR